MNEIYERTALMLGEEAVSKLNNARVAVFGLGGVGGHAVDALARAGIGTLDLIDNDKVDPTNINRQLIALQSTVGKYKTEAFAERIKDIDPDIKVNIHTTFFLPENSSDFDFSQYDYVIDAIDTIAAKVELARLCELAGTKLISSMGAGNKLDPTRFEVSDIYKTEVCPVAKAMRKRLKDLGIKKLKVVYSKEPPIKNGRTPGSVSFVPSVVGLILAGEVIKDLIS